MSSLNKLDKGVNLDIINQVKYDLCAQSFLYGRKLGKTLLKMLNGRDFNTLTPKEQGIIKAQITKWLNRKAEFNLENGYF